MTVKDTLKQLSMFPDLVGKRMKVRVPDRDNFGNQMPNQFKWLTGTCDFIGPNSNLDIPMQVTLNRTPFRINSLKDDVQLI